MPGKLTIDADALDCLNAAFEASAPAAAPAADGITVRRVDESMVPGRTGARDASNDGLPEITVRRVGENTTYGRTSVRSTPTVGYGSSGRRTPRPPPRNPFARVSSRGADEPGPAPVAAHVSAFAAKYPDIVSQLRKLPRIVDQHRHATLGAERGADASPVAVAIDARLVHDTAGRPTIVLSSMRVNTKDAELADRVRKELIDFLPLAGLSYPVVVCSNDLVVAARENSAWSQYPLGCMAIRSVHKANDAHVQARPVAIQHRPRISLAD